MHQIHTIAMVIRFAAKQGWAKGDILTSLTALLTGKALDVYSRISETAALDYELEKSA